MNFGALWQQAFAAALASARERGAAGFSTHSRTETVLAFSRAFRSLVSPFHKQNFGDAAAKPLS